jgi:hypothetical protein
VRKLSRSLAGYLCGTHSGLLAYGRGERLGSLAIANAHRNLRLEAAGSRVTLGETRWNPPGAAAALKQSLASALRHDAVIELIVFGSQARGTTTGFSDVDAVLVISDAAADDPNVLRSLRRSVLKAQRSVLVFQPMQHHGFEVVTPKLLLAADAALGAPREAFPETRSLLGGPIEMCLADSLNPANAQEHLHSLVRDVTSAPRWPNHPWLLHRLISMFELLPALYLQSRGRRVSKWASFGEAQAELHPLWWPYDVLREVRARWPRRCPAALEIATALVRNPWVVVAGWTRLPGHNPDPVRHLLSRECLESLQAVARTMAESPG